MGWFTRKRCAKQADIAGARRLAEEDVSSLGEQLQRLDDEVRDTELGEPGRAHRRSALERYDVAKTEVASLTTEEDVHALIEALSDGRYEIACVRAIAAGDDVPEKRVGCLFNPQHGPSVRDVVHTFSRTGTRKVPACAQCAVRVEAGEEPSARQVHLSDRTVPYWDAGSAYLSYLQGQALIPAAGASHFQAWVSVGAIGAAGAGGSALGGITPDGGLGGGGGEYLG